MPTTMFYNYPRPSPAMALGRVKRQSDLDAAASGYGPGYCPEGIPIEQALFALLAAFAAAFGFLFRTLTQITQGRKRKRSLAGNHETSFGEDNWWEEFKNHLGDQFYHGLEEFEHKIERLAEDGNAENDGSWISNVYHKFKDTFGFDDTNSIEGHAEIDGMEPPMLDERWGLGDVRTLYNSTANGTDLAVANGTEHSLSKRALYGSESVGNVEQDLDLGDLEKDFEADEHVRGLSGEEKCKAKFWKCTGKVVGGSMHYANEPGGVWGLAKKTMFRMAFHGKYGNVWNALMSVPEARAMKRCLNIQEECLGYEAIRAEAESEDKDRPRILVNPDFVENQDKSDGAEQYDPEEMKAFQKWLDSE